MHTFTVAGRGDFPFDMLRYDEAFPDATSDAMLLPYPTNEMGEKVRILDTQRSIKLLSFKVPTPGRWASFGWVVTHFNDIPVVDLRARG